MKKIRKDTAGIKKTQVNRKLHYKKMAALAVAGVLVAGSTLTGCGKKNIDYSVDGGSGNGGSADSGSLQDKYGIPESCDMTLETGDSGLSKLAIEADEVSVPSTMDLPIVYAKKKEISNDAKKQLVESLVEKDKGIYAFDYDNMTKADIQEQIDQYEKEKKNSAANGDTSGSTWYDSMIDGLKDQLQKAPDEYPAADDYSGTEFLGEIGGRKFLVNVDDQGGASGSMCLKDQLITYRPKDGASGVYFSTPDTGDDLTDVDMSSTNVCTFSKDEAQSIADEFVNKIGMADVTLNKAQDLYWYYYGADGNTDSVEVDGYVFSYTRSINNQPTASAEVWNVDNLMQDDASVSIPSEKCEVYVDSNGVISANWVNYFEITDKTESKDLLSFDELLKKANTNIAEYYTTYPTRYKKVEFNDMKLAYYLEKTDEDGVFKYVPAWILTQYEDMADESNNADYPDQMVVLDATDGSVIDLLELSKSLGTYQNYDTDTIARDVSDEGDSSITSVGDTDSSEDTTDASSDTTDDTTDDTTGDTAEK